MQSPSENMGSGSVDSDAVIGALMAREDRDGWPHALRLTAIGIFAETGSVRTASRETGIPKGTIEQWISKDEDAALFVSELRTAVRVQSAHKLLAGAVRAIDLTLEALNRGDAVLDRHGDVRYLPVKAKDAAFIASIFIDKHALVTGALTNGKTSDQLGKLAEQLTKLLSANNARPNSPSVEPEPDSSEPLIG